MDDKKKTIVVAALFVIILAVGAFQLTGGASTPPPTESATTKKDPKKTDEEPEDKVKNSEVSALLAVRDPFKPDTVESLPDLPPVPTPITRPVQQPPPLKGYPPLDPGDFGQIPLATDPLAAPDVFSYSLAGIVLGDHSAALFADGAGNQRLIREGSAIDGDSTVVAIARGKVTVSYKGKKQTLTLGGNPSGN